MARISLSPRVTRLGGSLFAVKIDECTMPPRVPFDSEKCNHTQYIHQKLHEHLSVWRSFRTLVGAFFWHYLVITMRWFHCGFHFSKFIQPSAPTRALLPPVTVTNKQQSEIPIFQCNAMKLTSCTGVWAVRGAGGTGPKGAGPNGAKGAKGGAAWGAKGGAGTCAANIGPWRTFEFDCINSCDGYTVIYKIVYICYTRGLNFCQELRP